jgi:hypothetical protein
VAEELFGLTNAVESMPLGRTHAVFLVEEADEMVGGNAAVGSELRQVY